MGVCYSWFIRWVYALMAMILLQKPAKVRKDLEKIAANTLFISVYSGSATHLEPGEYTYKDGNAPNTIQMSFVCPEYSYNKFISKGVSHNIKAGTLKVEVVDNLYHLVFTGHLDNF